MVASPRASPHHDPARFPPARGHPGPGRCSARHPGEFRRLRAGFSILAEPCGRASGETVGNDVVVCGKDADVQRLPLPDDRGPPDRPTPSNPYLRPDAALAAEGTPCAAAQGGCQVGIGGPLVAAAVGGLFTAVSDGVADAKVRKARRADAGKRVPIRLDD